jgi:hypothetical protein
VALVVPEPESAPDPEITSVAPETAPVAPELPPVALSVRPETTVVCEVIVEIAEVTVAIGSSCTPAIAAPLNTPPNASTIKQRDRMAADRIPLRVYPLLERRNS